MLPFKMQFYPCVIDITVISHDLMEPFPSKWWILNRSMSEESYNGDFKDTTSFFLAILAALPKR